MSNESCGNETKSMFKLYMLLFCFLSYFNLKILKTSLDLFACYAENIANQTNHFVNAFLFEKVERGNEVQLF